MAFSYWIVLRLKRKQNNSSGLVFSIASHASKFQSKYLTKRNGPQVPNQKVSILSKPSKIFVTIIYGQPTSSY